MVGWHSQKLSNFVRPEGWSPLYLRVLAFRAVKKSSYLPQTRYAKNRTEGWSPLYLRVLGFRAVKKSSYLPQTR